MAERNVKCDQQWAHIQVLRSIPLQIALPQLDFPLQAVPLELLGGCELSGRDEREQMALTHCKRAANPWLQSQPWQSPPPRLRTSAL